MSIASMPNPGKIEWQTKLSDWIRSKPAMTSKGLLVASVDGKIACLSKTDGKIQWSKKISTHQIYSDLVSAGDSVLVSDSDLWLRRIDASGDILWKRSLLNAYENEKGERIFTDVLSGGTYYQSKPTAADGMVYFGNAAGFLFGVDADTGKEIWKFEMGGAISVGPAVGEGKVFAGQQGGERFFYCVDATTGELVWKQTVPGGWVWGSAAYDDGMVYVPTVNGHAVCLDAKTGHIVWMYPTAKSVPAEPAIDGDLVFFGSWSGSLYAFHKKTGDIVWKVNGIELDSGTLIAYEGKIYVPHHSNVFMSFDAKTGAVLSEGNKNPQHTGNFSNFNATPAFFKNRAYYTARVGEGLRGVPNRLPRLLRGFRIGQDPLDLPRRRRALRTCDRQRTGFTSVPETPRSSTASTPSPANRCGSTSSASASRNPPSASTATRSSSSPAMVMSMPRSVRHGPCCEIGGVVRKPVIFREAVTTRALPRCFQVGPRNQATTNRGEAPLRRFPRNNSHLAVFSRPNKATISSSSALPIR